MNNKQKKEFLNDFKKYVSELLHRHNINALHDLNYNCMVEYKDIIETNQRAIKAGVKINKALTAYIIDRYQIAADAYVYNIDPLTGCKVK